MQKLYGKKRKEIDDNDEENEEDEEDEEGCVGRRGGEIHSFFLLGKDLRKKIPEKRYHVRIPHPFTE